MTEQKPISDKIKQRIESAKSFPVTWYLNVAKINEKGRRKIHFGYCAYGKGVAFVDFDKGSFLPRWLVIKDVIVSDICEDSDWCFNLDCPLNTVIVSKLPHQLGLTKMEHVQKLHALFAEAAQALNMTAGDIGLIHRYDKVPVIWKVQKQ